MEKKNLCPKCLGPNIRLQREPNTFGHFFLYVFVCQSCGYEFNLEKQKKKCSNCGWVNIEDFSSPLKICEKCGCEIKNEE